MGNNVSIKNWIMWQRLCICKFITDNMNDTMKFYAVLSQLILRIFINAYSSITQPHEKWIRGLSQHLLHWCIAKSSHKLLFLMAPSRLPHIMIHLICGQVALEMTGKSNIITWMNTIHMNVNVITFKTTSLLLVIYVALSIWKHCKLWDSCEICDAGR